MDAKISRAITKGFFCFNPRARDGREQTRLRLCHYYQSFNPRARDGREWLGNKSGGLEFVSIHAPVMDANSLVVIEERAYRFQSTRP